MIRINDIQENLIHLVGWEQNYDGSLELQISNSLTESESGIYFQQVHPLLTLQNMSCIAPDYKNIYYPPYSFETAYKKGSIVSASDEDKQLYRALKDCEGASLANAEYWAPTNPFSEWLENKTKASIQKTISKYILDKNIKGTYKHLFENKTLFDGTGRIIDTVKNQNNLVGFEIIPIRSKGVTTKINKIGLQFTEPGGYEIFIMHSSNSVPVYKLHFTKIRKNAMEWFNVDNIFLPYEGLYNDAGGSWYICYFQSDLPSGSQAIRKDRDWSYGPCESCSRSEYKTWQTWSKYLEVHPFFVNEELVQRGSGDFDNDFNNCFDIQPIHMWDIGKNQYRYDTNFGINLELTVGCDITDFIIEQKLLFADVIAKQLATDMLREFAYNANVRTNRHSINASRLDILYEIDGDSSSLKKSGLGYQLELAYKAIELSTEGIDRVCLPCKNNGVKYRMI